MMLAVNVNLILTVLVSVVGFTAIFLLVVAVFGHSGRTEISPQRRIAIAMGQGDRHTLFESEFFAPVMWVLLLMAEKLAMPRFKSRLRSTLIAAGSPNMYTAEEYLAVAMLWGLIVGVVLGVLNLLIFDGFSYVWFVFGVGLGLFALMYHVRDQAKKRVRDISRRVPYALDLIALAMGAGSTFIEALRTVVREDRQNPLNVELATVLAEIDLGTTRRNALANLAERVPLESLRSIVASIIQAEELGTPLTEVLKGQANLLRLQRSVRAEKLAALASVRILVPSVLILMSVVLTVFAPVIIRAVRGELF